MVQDLFIYKMIKKKKLIQCLNQKGFLIGQYTEELKLLQSAFTIIKSTFESFDQSEMRVKPAASCKETGLTWKSGKKFLA